MTDVSIEALTVEYRSGGEVIRPLDALSTEAASGELVLLLGPSGSGKTTLLSCLAGILTPTTGRIVVGSTEVTGLVSRELIDYRQRVVGTAFQSFNLVPSLTAEENVAVPLWAAGMPRRKAAARAAELLEQMGLADRGRHRPAALSGGQQQRVAIARALALDPPLVLADEPTGHLDYEQAEVVLRILREMASPGRLVVVATHDARLIPLGDRVIDLVPAKAGAAAGGVVELDPDQTLFREGEPSDLVYVVEEGEVALVRRDAGGKVTMLAVCKPGDYLGELGPMLGFPRTATARATRATRLTSLSVAEFRHRMGTDRRPRGAYTRPRS